MQLYYGTPSKCEVEDHELCWSHCPFFAKAGVYALGFWALLTGVEDQAWGLTRGLEVAGFQRSLGCFHKPDVEFRRRLEGFARQGLQGGIVTLGVLFFAFLVWHPWVEGCRVSSILGPKPSTLNPIPFWALNPQPHTLNPKP